VELNSVVEFKRQVYRQALTELARLLNRPPLPRCGDDYGWSGYGNQEQLATRPVKRSE
jgi:putative (di)nucleoside polyphosphate hydrolase